MLSLFTIVLDFEHPEIIGDVESGENLWTWWGHPGCANHSEKEYQTKWNERQFVKHTILQVIKNKSKCLPKGSKSVKKEDGYKGLDGKF